MKWRRRSSPQHASNRNARRQFVSNDGFATLILVSVCCNILHRIPRTPDQALSSRYSRPVWTHCRSRSAHDPSPLSRIERGARYLPQCGIRSSPSVLRQLDTTFDARPSPMQPVSQAKRPGPRARRQQRRRIREKHAVEDHISSRHRVTAERHSWRTPN